jgi:hypothetical protein
MARDAVHRLLASDVALDKLGARGISAEEAEQLPRNRHHKVRNPREAGEPGKRRLLIGLTDGGRRPDARDRADGRSHDLVIITGWESTVAERKILEASR